jgi:hypothetical protein
MSERPPTTADAVAAGGLLIGPMVACGAAGYGLGSLVDIAVPLGLVGFFAGLGVGFFLVHARFRRI